MSAANLGPSDDLTVMAHELRTPMAALRLLAETLVERYGQSPNVRRLGDQIRCLSRNMGDTLESMLDPRRLVRGAAAWEDCDLYGLAEDAVAAARPLLVSSPVRIVGPVGHALPMKGEPNALRRVMVNLLSNAVRHVSVGGILLALDHTRRRHAWNIITVSDTGTGMDSATLERVRSGDDSAGAGTGLGLRICRLIAHAHGGFLSIDSRAGEGATVRVHLRSDLGRPRTVGEPRGLRPRR